VVLFIFVVCNTGGCLLPIGDPPLFLGYLRGVDFFWTLHLWPYWLFMLASLLLIYYVWDRRAWRQETPADRLIDRLHVEPLRLGGLINLLWLGGVVAAVALLDPSKAVPGTHWHAPPYLREGVQLALVGLSLRTTAPALRVANGFNYVAIQEVAFLFIGIFITMQVPIEILQEAGPRMAAAGFVHPWQFFWATGALSGFLDNAPTYVVYFETAGALRPDLAPAPLLEGVNTATGAVSIPLLVAISCGAVFMGANTYIGNGPNFMVKTIAEQAGVRMPTFFGYMAYAVAVLVPLFIVLTLLFFA
jgi:Na+/H+ antiporter NhaD/arsenite permease-like protein